MKPAILLLGLGLRITAPFAPAGDTLLPNATLYMNQYIESGGGNFKLVSRATATSSCIGKTVLRGGRPALGGTTQ